MKDKYTPIPDTPILIRAKNAYWNASDVCIPPLPSSVVIGTAEVEVCQKQDNSVTFVVQDHGHSIDQEKTTNTKTIQSSKE